MTTTNEIIEEGYDARLENWSTHNNRLLGNIFQDKAKRFYDGEFVTTSTIVLGNVGEGKIVQTKSGTTYLLGRKYNG